MLVPFLKAPHEGPFGVSQATGLITRKKWNYNLGLSMNQIVKGYPGPIRIDKSNLWECLPKSDSNLMNEEWVGIALAVYETLGQASSCSLEDMPEALITVTCFAGGKKDQANIWLEAFITWTSDSFLDYRMYCNKCSFLWGLGGVACSDWS